MLYQIVFKTWLAALKLHCEVFARTFEHQFDGVFHHWLCHASFKIVVSDTAMYQQAGNSIVVDVLIALLKQMDITQYGVKTE